MGRIKFFKGQQRKFFEKIIDLLKCRNLRGLMQFGLDNSYDCLKNYYCERRLLPEELFYTLCRLAKIKPEDFKFGVLNENWGRIKGGKS